MEKVRDEMIKMSRDESERYLYLREQMAIRDKGKPVAKRGKSWETRRKRRRKRRRKKTGRSFKINNDGKEKD